MAELCSADEDDGFANCSLRFMNWLEQNGASISNKIELADLRDRSAGRGVLAKEDIAADESLFSIPRSSILTVETSRIPPEANGQLGDPWSSLILAMIYEYQQGTSSPWKPYFDLLPKDFDTLMYWADDELKGLKGSAVVDKIGRESADEAFKAQLLPIITTFSDLFHTSTLNDSDLLSLCHRMGSTIMAYAFDLEKPVSDQARSDEDGWEEDSDFDNVLPKGMIPLADMLNADAGRNNAKLFYGDDDVVMKAIKDIRSGEEIFNDYGPLPRADLLRRYGYITEEYSPNDVVEISLELIRTAAGNQATRKEKDIEKRLQHLDEQNALEDGYDIYSVSNENEQFSEELRVLLNTLTMPGPEFERLKLRRKLPEAELSTDALSLLSTILSRRQAMYPNDRTTVTLQTNMSDAEYESASKWTTRQKRRLSMAQKVILGEQAVIREAVEKVQQLLTDNNKRKAVVLEADSTPARSGIKKAKYNSGS